MGTSVFAYGSLALLQGGAHEHSLDGFTRIWGVAMDNREDIPGYKYYVDEAGRRPPVVVAYLDVAPSPGAAVNGLLLDVDLADLEVLDRRERNYQRVDVTAAVSPQPDGKVYAYVGSPAARRRLAQGLEAGACVVDRSYLAAVRQGFRALGDDALARFDASTASPPCPQLSLIRHDL